VVVAGTSYTSETGTRLWETWPDSPPGRRGSQGKWKSPKGQSGLPFSFHEVGLFATAARINLTRRRILHWRLAPFPRTSRGWKLRSSSQRMTWCSEKRMFDSIRTRRGSVRAARTHKSSCGSICGNASRFCARLLRLRQGPSSPCSALAGLRPELSKRRQLSLIQEFFGQQKRERESFSRSLFLQPVVPRVCFGVIWESRIRPQCRRPRCPRHRAYPCTSLCL
jgi:hypothetical protein